MDKCLATFYSGGGGKKENANADCIALMTKSSRLFIKSAISQALFNVMDQNN